LGVKIFIDSAAKLWKILPREGRRSITRIVHPKFTVSVTGIITNEADEVLLLDHVLRPQSGWGPPGGFIAKDEQPETALRREIREETGLELRDVSLHRCRTLGRHVEVIFRATAVGEAVVSSREITTLGWFAVEEMPPEMSLDLQFVIRDALRPE